MSKVIFKNVFFFILISSENVSFGYFEESPKWLPQRDDSNKCLKHMCLEVLDTMFLHTFWLTVTCANVSWRSNYHYTCNVLYRCIEFSYKEGWLYHKSSWLNYSKRSLVSGSRLICILFTLSIRKPCLSKQYRPRSDVTERGVWSGSARFATHPAIV